MAAPTCGTAASPETTPFAGDATTLVRAYQHAGAAAKPDESAGYLSEATARTGHRSALLAALARLEAEFGHCAAAIATQVAREVLRRRGVNLSVHVGFTRHPKDAPGEGFSQLTAWVATDEGVTDLIVTPGMLRAPHLLGRPMQVRLDPAAMQRVVTEGAYGAGGADWKPFTPTFHASAEGGHVPNVNSAGKEVPLAAHRAALARHVSMPWRDYCRGAGQELRTILEAIVAEAVQRGDDAERDAAALGEGGAAAQAGAGAAGAGAAAEAEADGEEVHKALQPADAGARIEYDLGMGDIGDSDGSELSDGYWSS